MRKKITRSIFVLAGLIFLSDYCMASPKSYYQYAATGDDIDYPAVAANSSLLLCAYIDSDGRNSIIVKGEPKYRKSGDGEINNWLENTEESGNWNQDDFDISHKDDKGMHIENNHIGLALNDNYAVLVWDYNKGDDRVACMVGKIIYNTDNIPTKIVWGSWFESALGYSYDTDPSVIMDSNNNVAISYLYQNCLECAISTAYSHVIDDNDGNPTLKHLTLASRHYADEEIGESDDSTGICFTSNGKLISLTCYGDDYTGDIGTYNTLYDTDKYITWNKKIKFMLIGKAVHYPTICQRRLNGGYYVSSGANDGSDHNSYIYILDKDYEKCELFDSRLGGHVQHQTIASNGGNYLFAAYRVGSPANRITVRIYPSDESFTSTQPDSNGDCYRLVSDRREILKINSKNQEIDSYHLPFSAPNEISVISNQIDGVFIAYQSDPNGIDYLVLCKDGKAAWRMGGMLDKYETDIKELPNIIIKKDSDNTDLLDGILCVPDIYGNIHIVPFAYNIKLDRMTKGTTSSITPTGRNTVLCWLPNNNEFVMFCNGVHNPDTLYSRIGTFTDSSNGGAITWHENYAQYYLTAPNPTVYSTGSELYLARKYANSVIYIERAGLNPTGEKFNFSSQQIMENTENCRNPVLLNNKYISYINPDGEIETVNFADSQKTGMKI